ncbi:hypothetical protein H5410_004541 [Solanum commersonii]|uniref:Uncharacterized protein n=1 Tax=Solanum commersonii TaxID=4109 RepID=A0A9J6B7Y6_SOLCO|nr:hypothetical protein H5410_004541 [Solanum commersonii]
MGGVIDPLIMSFCKCIPNRYRDFTVLSLKVQTGTMVLLEQRWLTPISHHCGVTFLLQSLRVFTTRRNIASLFHHPGIGRIVSVNLPENRYIYLYLIIVWSWVKDETIDVRHWRKLEYECKLGVSSNTAYEGHMFPLPEKEIHERT